MVEGRWTIKERKGLKCVHVIVHLTLYRKREIELLNAMVPLNEAGTPWIFIK